MTARNGPDYPPTLLDQHPQARDADGEQVTTGRYPVVNIGNAWELYSMLGVTLPGIEHYYRETDGQRIAWLLHPDDFWARATAIDGNPPIVSQSGPRRLWDSLDEIRYAWLRDGNCPHTGPTSPSLQTAQSPSRADAGGQPSPTGA